MNLKSMFDLRSVLFASVLSASLMGTTGLAQSPTAGGCSNVAVSTPESSMGNMDHGSMGDMEMEQVEFDLMYIDMMIPHHESIIALAQVAQHELTHPDLIAMAEGIIATQDSEILELQVLREEWYGDAAPVSMEAMHSMPGMSGDMAAMEQQMSAEWQVQTFCAAEDKDLAFIELTIPHHQMAIDTSEAALDHAEHQEIKDIAQKVIDAQQAEIDALETIRAELTGEATPEA